MKMLLFPHKHVRPSQEDFIKQVTTAVRDGKNLIIHAPTGLGKTAAALSPALSEALQQENKTVFFLTSRHTQHDIALKTLEDIRDRHGKHIKAVDIIGKKHMCLQPGVERLPANEFTEFCRAMREDGKCDYYTSLKKGEKITTQGKLVLEALNAESPIRNSKIVSYCDEHKVCPYYASMELAKEAKIIIGDYYYVFHPRVREQFFTRSENELEDAIIIVDEAHNLPNRIKDLASARLSNLITKRAIAEAKKHQLEDVEKRLEGILELIENYARRAGEKGEAYVTRQEFIMGVERTGNYDELVETLLEHGDRIREQSKVSYIGAVGTFLESWLGKDEGYTRILQIRRGLREAMHTLHYRCLDPSVISAPIIKAAKSTIMMSGTLTPTAMYREILGFDKATELHYPSPFPEKNRLNIIIPKTSTKYATRSDEQYKNIAEVINKVTAKIPGNSAVFFPSYYLLKEVSRHFNTKTEKTVFTERQEMSTGEKQEFIDRFRQYKDAGAVLMGVISGNFGEGIDLPGDELKGVVVVGLPLNKPDLETESIIKYYDQKFRKGWDYGYLFPAINKTLQSAGRCIRSETDRGVIVFLDERYAAPNYKRCFPADWDIKISLLYERLIEDFFRQQT